MQKTNKQRNKKHLDCERWQATGNLVSVLWERWAVSVQNRTFEFSSASLLQASYEWYRLVVNFDYHLH